MKYSWKPCVCAWVQTKNATPKITPSRLKISERFRLTVNPQTDVEQGARKRRSRQAALFFGFAASLDLDRTHALAGVEGVLVLDDDLVALVQCPSTISAKSALLKPTWTVRCSTTPSSTMSTWSVLTARAGTISAFSLRPTVMSMSPVNP